jgi:hypothetical protein
MGMYDSPAARLNELYRLSLASTVRRVVVIGVNTNGVIDFPDVDVISHFPESDLISSAWTPEHTDYDAAVVHILDGSDGVSTPIRTAKDFHALFRNVHRMLRTGGSITGQLPNRFRLDTLLKDFPTPQGAEQYPRRPPGFTPRSCHQLLQQTGFDEIDIFTVLPTPGAPEAVVPVHRKYSQPFFVDTLAAGREEQGTITFWLRLALIRSGIYSQVVGSYLFKAEKS